MALLLQILLVSGGWTGSDRLDDFTEIFDPSLGSWRAGAELRRPRSRLRATNIDNRVLLFGINILLAFNMSYIILTPLQVAMMEVISTLSWSMTLLATPTKR